MITSSFWKGTIAGKFEDKFKIVDKEHDELFDNYTITVLFYAAPDKTYDFDVSVEVFAGGKPEIAKEILKQLSKNV